MALKEGKLIWNKHFLSLFIDPVQTWSVCGGKVPTLKKELCSDTFHFVGIDNRN